MKTLFLVIIAVSAAIWGTQRMEMQRLQVDLAMRRDHLDALAKLKAERERLSTLRTLLETGVDPTRAPASAVARQAESVESLRLVPGEWIAADQCRDTGFSTIKGTLETMLSAAAGGDISRFSAALQLDPRDRQKLEATFANVPAEQRSNFGTPEALVSAYAMKGIPRGQVELFWVNQQSPDEGHVALFVQHPRGSDGTPLSTTRGLDRIHYVLSLRREGGTWRVLVPTSAVDELVRNLTKS